jgi:hypothetical protein
MSLPSNTTNEKDLHQIMAEIETKTEKKVMKARFDKNSTKPAGDTLIGIMNEGVDEFKEKTGRNMTYIEMRQMFG